MIYLSYKSFRNKKEKEENKNRISAKIFLNNQVKKSRRTRRRI